MVAQLVEIRSFAKFYGGAIATPGVATIGSVQASIRHFRRTNR